MIGCARSQRKTRELQTYEYIEWERRKKIIMKKYPKSSCVRASYSTYTCKHLKIHTHKIKLFQTYLYALLNSCYALSFDSIYTYILFLLRAFFDYNIDEIKIMAALLDIQIQI